MTKIINKSYLNPKSSSQCRDEELKAYQHSFQNIFLYDRPTHPSFGVDKYQNIFQKIDAMDSVRLRSLWYLYIRSLGKKDDLFSWIESDDDKIRSSLKQAVAAIPDDALHESSHVIDTHYHYSIPDDKLDLLKYDNRFLLFVAYAIQVFIPKNTLYIGFDELRRAVIEMLRYGALLAIGGYYIPKFNIMPSKFHASHIAFERLTFELQDIKDLKKIYQDNKLSVGKDASWIKKNNKQQIKWIYEYFERQGLLCLQGIFIPKTDLEKFDLILASLDILSNIPDPSIKLEEPHNETGFNKKGQKDNAIQNYPAFVNHYFTPIPHAHLAEPYGINIKKQKKYSQRSLRVKRTHKNWLRVKPNLKSNQKEDLVIKVYKRNAEKIEQIADYLGKTKTQTINLILEEAFKASSDEIKLALLNKTHSTTNKPSK